MRHVGRAFGALSVVVTVGVAESCDGAQARPDGRRAAAADSMGAVPTAVVTVDLRSRRDLVENSAAAMSAWQPGVLFTINDSGNEALLFALDTPGADRGAWRVQGSTDIDWEAAS